MTNFNLNFLKKINGNTKGRFAEWLDSNKPVIGYYPSAGNDFRPLLHLGLDKALMQHPNIYVYTSYMSFGEPTFLSEGIAYQDTHTTVRITYAEEVNKLDFPLHKSLVDFPERKPYYGKVYFLMVQVESRECGTFESPVVYFFVENATFADFALREKASFEFIFQLAYGMGWGGSHTGCCWLTNVLKKLQCRWFITDLLYTNNNYIAEVYKLFPALTPSDIRPVLSSVKSCLWSQFNGSVDWFAVG